MQRTGLMPRWFVVLVVIAALLVPTGVAQAATTNGAIVFYRPGVGGSPYTDLYAANPDGTGQHPLTATPPWNEVDPAWSPDGTRLAFTQGSYEIVVTNSDGTNPFALTASVDGGAYEPSWSPLGDRLMFSRFIDGATKIWIIDDDGGNLTQLTHGVGHDGYPAWSPDGTQFVFISDRDGSWDLYLASVGDPDNPTQLTNNAAIERGADWSPDGGWVVFSNDRSLEAANTDIYKLDTLTNGATPVRLTTNAATDTFPSWSPNGLRILFSSSRDPSGIYKMDLSGGNQTKVPNLDGTMPDWQPCPGGACAPTVETIPPNSDINIPLLGDSYSQSQLPVFEGTASDEGIGLRRVSVALRRKMTDRSCRWWDGNSWVARRCNAFLWRRAQGLEAWTYDVQGLLPRSVGTRTDGYVLFARAIDLAGNIESIYELGRNKVSFEVE